MKLAHCDSPAGQTDQTSEWKAGGPMLAAAMVGNCFSAFPVNVLGPLINPLEAAFGWSRAEITSAVLITAVGTICIAPVAGRIVDRIGPRRMALVCLPLLCMAIALIGLAGPSIWSWYACWAVFGVAQACAGNIVWTKAVVGRFDRNRGMALAILLSGAALAHGLLPSFAFFILSVWDWRAIYFIFAISGLVIGWPLAWRYFYGAHDQQRREVRTKAVKPKNLPLPEPGLVRKALRTRQFWQMALSFFIVGSAVAALYVHFVPVLIAAGFSSHAAATVAIVLGPAAIAGRLGGGYFLDRFPPNRVVAVALILPAVSYAILMFGATSLIAVYVCALLLGIVLGAEADFMGYLVSRYFGPQAFGSLYGLLLGIFAVGYGVGPYMTGRLFDATKSYQLSFAVFAWAALAGAVLIARLGPAPRSWSPRPQSAASPLPDQRGVQT